MSVGEALERAGGLDAQTLRRAFDESFALPERGVDETLEDVIVMRVCSESYAVRGRELSGIAALRKLTVVPSSTSELLGLVSVRGVLVPVFGLAALLGYEADSEPSRWLLLVGSDEPVGLAFHELVGFERLSSSAFSLAESQGGADGARRETVSFEEQVRVVIGVPALVTRIRDRLRQGATEEGSVK
jgi:chemotaxis signal transduction protein